MRLQRQPGSLLHILYASSLACFGDEMLTRLICHSETKDRNVQRHGSCRATLVTLYTAHIRRLF